MEGEDVLASTWFSALQSRFKDVLQRAAREGLYVCVPQSCSLDLAPLTRALVEHHVLRGVEGRVGEFLTLSDRSVLVRDMTACTGRGFGASVEARVLSTHTLAVSLSSAEPRGKLHLYFLSRPLEGGLAAPASVDELTPAALTGLLGYLHMSPEAEGPLARFSAQVQALVAEFSGKGSEADEAVAQWLAKGSVEGEEEEEEEEEEGEEEGGGRSGEGEGVGAQFRDWSVCNLALQLQSHAAEAAEELMSVCDSLVPSDPSKGGGSGAQEALWRRLLLCLQSEASRKLSAPLMHHLRRALAPECRTLGNALSDAAALPPAACAQALGIARKFFVAQEEAQRVLAGLEAATCPLSKLQVLLAARGAIISAIEQDLTRREISLADVAFGADDTLPQMTLVLAQCFAQGPGTAMHRVAADFPVHLSFIQLCHHPLAGSLSQSRMGYTLANWDSASRLRGSLASAVGGAASGQSAQEPAAVGQ